MPISSQTPIIGYVANGVSTAFTFPFVILSADDLKVSVNNALVTTGLTITGVGDRDGGTVTFSAPPAASEPIILYREVSLERTTDYQENGDLLASVLDDDLDRLWAALQDQAVIGAQALRVPVGETVSALPKASERALKALGFDSLGRPIALPQYDASSLAIALQNATPSNDGAALVGADDGDSGSLFTTVAGFISKILTAGASVIPFDWAAIPAAINKIDWGIRTAARGQNVLRWIPPAEWAAIFSGTSYYDATAAIQSAIDAKGEAWLPGDGAYKITAPLTVGFGQKLRGANARIVQYTNNTPIIAVSSSKWEVSGLRLEYATQQGASDTAAMGVTFNGAFEGEFTNSVISRAYKGFGVSVATSFAYECTFRNLRVIDAYDYGVSFDVNGSIGLTTNTFDNVYVLQTSVGTASPASKGFLIQYHTGGFVMRNCATDKLQGGVLLFMKGCSGVVVDSFYGEANTMKNGAGFITIDACADVNIRGYLPWTNTGILGAGQTASFVRITGSSRGINISGRENGTNVTGNLGTIYGIDCNSSNTAIRVNAREFVSDSGFARLDALITGSYYQVWSYSGQVLQDEVLTRKIQYRSAAPTTGTWAQGDTVVNSSPGTSSPVDKWRCIIAGTPGTWRPFGWTVLRGTTAARPTLGAQDVGVQYLDNTLDADGKPIWWNGTAWVDATGAAV